MRVDAPAKINWTLEILGRRPDGYHALASVVQAVDWADRLEIRAAPELSYQCDRPPAEQAADLTWRAAQLLRDALHLPRGAALSLDKRLPAAAGLGGGSSDAAAALRGLIRLWRPRLPVEQQVELAARLGSDVPFFLWGGTARIGGRGEEVEPLPAATGPDLVLLVPRLELPEKTRRVFGALRPEDFGDGGYTRALVECLQHGERIVPTAACHNGLESAALRVWPELADWRRRLEDATGQPAILCGAGPSWYSPVESRAAGQRIARRLRRRGWIARCARPLTGYHPGE